MLSGYYYAALLPAYIILYILMSYWYSYLGYFKNMLQPSEEAWQE